MENVTEVNLSPYYLATQIAKIGKALTAAKTDVATHKQNARQAKEALRAREGALILQGIDGANAEMRRARLATLTESERDTLTEVEEALAQAELEVENLHIQWKVCLELNALAQPTF